MIFMGHENKSMYNEQIFLKYYNFCPTVRLMYFSLLPVHLCNTKFATKGKMSF